MPPVIPALLLNEIAQVFQLDSEVDVVDHHVFGDMKNDGREIEYAHDAGLYQIVRDFLGNRRRHGHDRHLDMMGLDEIWKLLHAEDRQVNVLVAPPFGLDVERRNDLESLLFKSAIRKERQTEIADTDENHRLEARRAELVGNHLRQRGYLITETARAELAEVSEILSELGGFDARDFREGFARNSLNIVIP